MNADQRGWKRILLAVSLTIAIAGFAESARASAAYVRIAYASTPVAQVEQFNSLRQLHESLRGVTMLFEDERPLIEGRSFYR